MQDYQQSGIIHPPHEDARRPEDRDNQSDDKESAHRRKYNSEAGSVYRRSAPDMCRTLGRIVERFLPPGIAQFRRYAEGSGRDDVAPCLVIGVRIIDLHLQ